MTDRKQDGPGSGPAAGCGMTEKELPTQQGLRSAGDSGRGTTDMVVADTIDVERLRRTNLAERRPQQIDVLDKQALPSIQQVDGEEIAAAINAPSSIVRHARDCTADAT